MQERKEKTKIKVGILRGGDFSHHEESISNGAELISFISKNLKDKYIAIDIFVDQDNVWHYKGIPILPADLIHKIDIVWNTSNPLFGVILNNLGIPNISIEAFHHMVSKDKEILKEQMKKINIHLPRTILFPKYQVRLDGDKEKYILDKAKKVLEKFPSPWLVKSFNENSQTGIHVAKTFPQLVSSITDIVDHGQSILVEEFIVGKHAKIHLLSNFKNKEIYSFIPYRLKYGFFSEEKLSKEEKENIVSLAEKLFKDLDIRHYVDFTFVISPRSNVFLSNISFFPSFKEDSNFSKSAEAIGIKTHHIMSDMINKNL